MDWKRKRLPNLRVPENHPCCAYMDFELVSLLLTRMNTDDMGADPSGRVSGV